MKPHLATQAFLSRRHFLIRLTVNLQVVKAEEQARRQAKAAAPVGVLTELFLDLVPEIETAAPDAVLAALDEAATAPDEAATAPDEAAAAPDEAATDSEGEFDNEGDLVAGPVAL